MKFLQHVDHGKTTLTAAIVSLRHHSLRFSPEPYTYEHFTCATSGEIDQGPRSVARWKVHGLFSDWYVLLALVFSIDRKTSAH
jgi:hypothetical protein